MARPRKNLPPKILPAENASCVIYTRVSSREQAQEGFSLDAQLRKLTDYAAAKGFTVYKVIVEDESAKRAGRPEFAQMVRIIETKDIRHLVVEKTDRLYRNFKDQVTVGDLIEEKGLHVHLETEKEVLHKGSTAHQKFVHDLKLILAKNYIDNLRDEVKKGMTEKARQGIWPSVAPLGYRNVIKGAKRVIEPDPVESPLIRDMFAMYATGAYSIKSVGKVATMLGLKSRKGKRIPISALHLILHNPLYMGVIRWNGETYPGVHEPIVERRVWERVQAVLEARSDNAGGGTAAPEYAYRGLITCGRCGCACSPYTVKGTYVYYACTGAKGCKRTGIREEEITRQVAQALESLSIRPQVMELLRTSLRESFAAQRHEHEERQALLNAEHKRLTGLLERLYDDKLAGEVPNVVYTRKKTEWEGQLQDLEDAIAAENRANRATWEESAQMMELVSNSASRFKEASSELRRTMFQSMVSNSQLVDGKIVLELRPWFKSVMETNLRVVRGELSETDLVKWLPAMDSNHD